MEGNTDTGFENDNDDIVAQVDSLLISGEEASRSGDSKTALAAFNKAISLDPSSDMAWFNRGVLLEAQQDARGAETNLPNLPRCQSKPCTSNCQSMYPIRADR